MPGSDNAPGRAGSLRWPLIVLGMLACHFFVMITVAAIAMRDRSSAVLPDYYSKALNWDKTQAARRESDKLGWKLVIEPATTVDPLGRRSLTFVLSDAQDQPVKADALNVSYYHHSRAGDTATARLSPTTAPGRFVASLAMRHAGFWQFDVTATDSSGHAFTASQTQYVNNEGAK
jgi:nitrogen fixation protein FixH